MHLEDKGWNWVDREASTRRQQAGERGSILVRCSMGSMIVDLRR